MDRVPAADGEPDGRALRRLRTREDILRTARQIVEEKGADAVGLVSVARVAGVSRRTVYDHFGSRAGLLVALAAQADDDIGLAERLAHVFGSGSARKAIAALIELVAEVTPGMLGLASAIERAREHDADASLAWEDRMASRLAACRALAARLQAEGDLRPGLSLEVAADLIYVAISWQVWQILVVERRWSPASWVSQTQALLEGALMTEGSPAGGRAKDPRKTGRSRRA